MTLHYQWLIWNDYLPRIVQKSVLDDVFANGRKLVEPDAGPTDVPAMPIEFSVAGSGSATAWCGRRTTGTGASPTRPGPCSGCSSSRREVATSAGTSSWPATGSPTGAGCTTSRRRHADLAAPNGVNKALRLDTHVADPLQFLPASVFGCASRTWTSSTSSATSPSATWCAARCSSSPAASRWWSGCRRGGVSVEPLTRNQILGGKGGAKLNRLTDDEKEIVASRTPLWFYILREAETGNGRMRRVGGRIVAETFHRALEGSRFSILREPTFTPTFGRGDTFEMTDLLFFAFGKTGLNPLGGP